MRGRLLIVTFFSTVVISSIFMLVDNAYAFLATSTSFDMYQVISGVGAGSYSAWSTSSSFSEVGDNEPITASSSGGSLILNSGLLWDIVSVKSLSGGTTLSFTVDSATENFPTLTPGKLVATTSILSVTTNSSTGYNVTVVRNDSTGTMKLGSTYIPDATAWVPGGNCTTAGNGAASTTGTYEPTLEFRVRQAGTDSSAYCSAWWGTDDTSANARFAGIPPTTAQKIITRSTSFSGASVSYVLYNLDVPSIQKNGTYSGGITYTASTGP